MADAPKEPAAGEGQPPKKGPQSIVERLRAEAAAKAAGADKPPAPAAPSEAGAQPPPPGKPMSKLEAARAAAAAKAGGTAPQPETKPKAEKPARAEAKPKPERPLAKPEKPRPVAEPAGGSRRFFLLTWIGVAWTAFISGCSAAVLAGVRFLYPNVLQEPPSVFKVGPPDRFEEGNVYEQWKNEYGVWLVRNEGTLYAIRTVCTHLGCTPNWLEAEQKFKCPCHGSGFRKTGINFEGPAPRPLERFAIFIGDDGQVQIDKSRKYQQELGQWTEENQAFIKLG